MKLGLLGDIHGNHFALTAVLTACRQAHVQKLVITGDFVGYYFWPSEVMDLLDEWDVVAVRGNHEEMLARALDQPAFLEEVDAKYGTGLREAINALSPFRLQWLLQLPHPLEIAIGSESLLVGHGSPWEVDQYLYPNAAPELLKRCATLNHKWVILGHTHYPMVKKIGHTTVINPGSVGQARNHVSAAHWALLDTNSGELTMKTEIYDMSPVVELARLRHPEIPYLSDVLTRHS